MKPWYNELFGFENGMTINMGQILSIPFMVIGLILIFMIKDSMHNKV